MLGRKHDWSWGTCLMYIKKISCVDGWMGTASLKEDELVA